MPGSESGTFSIDPDNPVVVLCPAGMAVEGSSHEAIALFEQAWACRTDDYDDCIAAHFFARHQLDTGSTSLESARASACRARRR